MMNFRKLGHADHVQHIYFDRLADAQRFYKTGAADGVTGAGLFREVRLQAEAHGFWYHVGASLVWSWFSPLRFLAPHLHRLPKIRGEAIFTEQPYRNPFKRWCVTRTLGLATR